MWELLSNPITTHVGVFALGAGLAWYATHKTAVQAVATAIGKDAASVDAAIKKIGD